MNKYELIDIKFIDMYHFQMWEGKFKDLEQEKYQNKEVYVYANVSNIDTKTFEESDVRVYAHSFETLYCAEDYELYNFGNDVLEYFKEMILNNKEVNKMGFVWKTNYHSGGGVIVHYGLLSNGNYFTYSLDTFCILDSDYGETLTEKFFEETDGDTYDWDKEHCLKVYDLSNEYPTEIKEIIRQLEEDE